MSQLLSLSELLEKSSLNCRLLKSDSNELWVSFCVRAKPGAKLTKVSCGSEGELLVWVNARAVEGAANKAIEDALADALGVSRSMVTLSGGASGRVKQFAVCFRRKDNQSIETYLKKVAAILESN